MYTEEQVAGRNLFQLPASALEMQQDNGWYAQGLFTNKAPVYLILLFAVLSCRC
jgi:hypothetical protein